jgi:cation transport ATPase
MRRGIDVRMVTQDSFASASLVARLVGIHAENVFADCLPTEKAEVVTEMRRRGPVTFVGDNLNDFSAFASSSFSIDVVSDMSLGSNPLSASADAYLLPLATRSPGTHTGFSRGEASRSGGGPSLDSVNLTRLIYLISLSSATVRRVKQSLLWTAVYNILSLVSSSGALYFLDPSLTLSP